MHEVLKINKGIEIVHNSDLPSGQVLDLALVLR